MENGRLVTLLLLVSLICLLLISCQPLPRGGQDDDQEEQESPRKEQGQDEDQPAADSAKTASVSVKSSPLSKYKYTWTESDNIPDVVIIVDDFGNSGHLLEDFAKLPSQVVFAVLPDLSHTRRAGEIAIQYNHEVLIHVPMQPENAAENPGKTYIKTTDSAERISAILEDFHAQLPMAMGANNHMGSAVTANTRVMKEVLTKMHDLGLIFVDSNTTSKTVAQSLASSLGYPALKRDIFLDVPDNSEATLVSKINELGKYKGRREPVIIITHCHNQQKLDALRSFITQIESMGVKLTTLSRARNLSS